jgi:hypothetical protein
MALNALPFSLVALVALVAGCGGDGSPPQLVDGSRPAAVPAVLAGLDGAVMTRARTVPASDHDRDRLVACGLPFGASDTVVERVGLEGSSLTFAGGSGLNGCDAIPDPAEDPDRPYGGIWCGASVGRVTDGVLNDPRLDLCTAESGEVTAFVWVEPQPAAKWVVVSDAGSREVYEVAGSLPVRVTTTEGVRAEGSALFDIEEYGADGTRLREYTLEAAVAG